MIILCPIINLSSKETVQNNKIESQEESTETGKNESGDDKSTKNTLYDYEKPTAEEESYVWLIFKTIIVLAALVGAFYYFYRFVTKKTGLATVGREVAKILSIVPVGQNKFLQVIDLAGRVLVIGVSDSSINLITEIREKDDIDRIRLLSSKSSPISPGGFQEYISRYISKLFKKETAYQEKYDIKYQDNIHADSMDYLKKQRERLKKINGNDEE